MANDQDNTETEDESSNGESDNMRQLREAAARGSQAQRELAWVKAGFDTDDPLVATVMGAYTGELSKEAVTKYATDIGLTPGGASTTSEPDETLSSDSERRRQELINAHQDRENLKDTAEPNDGEASNLTDPHQRGLKGFREALKEGYSRGEAAGEYLGSIVQGAADGDKRATFTGWTGDDAVRASGR